ncbi:putative zinc-binding protein [Desulfosporosinus sp.]|uniref:putative zinc-binding protein n=1 Tax=Desulfosporosinus sp. TaxID=157907 RepID=UPI002614C4A6|nr:putative zinc-binding protein [Desulfosporosinus sp.]
MKIGIVACSGASNTGILTTKAALKALSKDENLGIVCAMGIPLGLENIVANAKKHDKFIALNGCELQCATKVLATIELKPDQNIVLTKDLNIAKNENYDEETHLEEVVDCIIKTAHKLKEE